MVSGSQSDQDILCQLIWKLARAHGWSGPVDIDSLARDANVQDERRARQLARDELPAEDFIGFDGSRDEIWLTGPPDDEVIYYLRDECDYGELQIEATFSSYFDGFDG